MIFQRKSDATATYWHEQTMKARSRISGAFVVGVLLGLGVALAIWLPQ